MQTTDISIFQLVIGFVLVLIPTAILYYYRTGIVKAMLVSIVRMTVQLFLVGFYLNYLFEWNNAWVNISWLLIMMGVCTVDLINRIKMPLKVLFIPIYMATFVSLAFIVVYFLKGVLAIDNLFDSRFFIPICGIVLGNILSSNVIGLNAFYGGIVRERQQYYYLLGNGATQQEAIAPFIKDALVKAFNPTIANMAVMGLISLPGTLIGQILGGSSPDVAIRYQIMMMIIIFTSSILSLLTSLLWSARYTFDAYGRYNAS